MIKTDDPQLNLIKEAINATNYNFGPAILMTEPDVNNVITFHSRYHIMVHSTCPDNDQYLKSVLDSFFYAKEAVRNNFQNLNVKQAEQHKNRRQRNDLLLSTYFWRASIGFNVIANATTQCE